MEKPAVIDEILRMRAQCRQEKVPTVAVRLGRNQRKEIEQYARTVSITGEVEPRDLPRVEQVNTIWGIPVQWINADDYVEMVTSYAE
jgi:hypothetical protein